MAKAISSVSAKLLRSAVITRKLFLDTKFAVSSSGIMTDVPKPRETAIKIKLTETFKPAYLRIINESKMHKVPKDSETHFKVVIVSDAFEGATTIQRHRQVNTALEEEFSNGLYALAIEAKTPSQWEKASQEVRPSPPCRGGAGL